MPNFFVSYRRLRPIIEGLQNCGYTVTEDIWKPKNADLVDCDGYLIDMYAAMKRPWDTISLKAKLHARKIPLLGWNRDAPWNTGAKRRRLWWFRQFRILDIYATHSLQGAEGYARNFFYLPNAAWTDAYNLAGRTLEELRDKASYLYDLSFIGNLNAVKYPEYSQRAAFFSALEERLALLGIRTCFCQGLGMPVAEQVEIIQRSRINISFGAACDDGLEKSWGLPERCYGVPACGGFLLSDERKHAAADFAPGLEWASFNDIDECVEKIRFYLTNFHLARDIAEKAHHRVLKEHTYVHRAATMVDAARQWRTERGIRLATVNLPVAVRRAGATINT